MYIKLKYFYNTCILCDYKYIDNIYHDYCGDCFNTIDRCDVIPEEILENIVKPTNILEQFSKI